MIDQKLCESQILSTIFDIIYIWNYLKITHRSYTICPFHPPYQEENTFQSVPDDVEIQLDGCHDDVATSHAA